MSTYLFRGGRFLDPRKDELQEGVEVFVEDALVREVSDRPIQPGSAQIIELGDRTLMPGLIDNHVHMYYFLSASGSFHMHTVPTTFSAAMATCTLRAMLMRGFTSVRDMGGGDYGMRDASEAGFVETPRLFLSGRAISQTGGHGDFRTRVDASESSDICCTGSDLMCIIADGVPDVIRAVRNELRKGADQIKLMLSGGVASPNDPLESIQFTVEEIAAAVDEARRWGVYVGAHAYSNEAIMRGVRHGVRTVEHDNFLEAEGAALMQEKGAFLVPTLITYEMNKRLGAASGKSESALRKNDIVHAAGLKSLDICRSAGVPIGFGTDLMTYTQKHQTDGLAVQAQVQSRSEVIRSATLVNAQILGQEGKLGELLPGAFADLLIVEGNPLDDLGVFQDSGTRLAAIMKAGRFVKNALQ
ncbi:Imidazolonepropionase [Rhizobiales bacterium GAS191]|nr:Imidazolonepropionase [Rhizobiales bacterium GAS191]